MSKPVKILVTGADGFIGSHLTERLVAEGHDVRAMVMYNAFGSVGRLAQLPVEVQNKIEIFPADVCDLGRVTEALQGVTHLFHLASLIGIPYSYHAARSYLNTNVGGSLNLLQAAKQVGVSQFIHTSTSEVYGSAQKTPMNESHPLVGQSPYAASKIGADQMVNAFGVSHDLPVTTIRPFNTYGPRQSARAVIPTIIVQLASGKREIELGSLTPRRDLTFVGDLVSGFIAALDNSETVGRTINIGAGEDHAIGDLAIMIGKLMGVEFTIKTDPNRVRPEKSEVSQLLADNSLAQELLGWSPTVSIEDWLRKTIEYFRQPEILANFHPDRYEI